MHGTWHEDEKRWIAAIGAGGNLRTFPWDKRTRMFCANFTPANTRDVSSQYNKELKRTPEVQALIRFLESGHPNWQFDAAHAGYIWNAVQILNTLAPEWRCEIPQDRMSDAETKALLGIRSAGTGNEDPGTKGDSVEREEWSDYENVCVTILGVTRRDRWEERQKWFDEYVAPDVTKDIRARYETVLQFTKEAEILKSYFFGEPRFHVKDYHYCWLAERAENVLYEMPQSIRCEISKDLTARQQALPGYPFIQ